MAERERWEVEITVPPVTDEIVEHRVRCGSSFVEVKANPHDAGRWGLYRGAYPATDVLYEGRDEALGAARVFVLAEERRRLLDHAVDEALRTDAGEVSRG